MEASAIEATQIRADAASEAKKYKGVWFILPWFAGFIFLFLIPLINSLRYSFSTLKVDETGFSIYNAGWSNYKNACFRMSTMSEP